MHMVTIYASGMPPASVFAFQYRQSVSMKNSLGKSLMNFLIRGNADKK